MAPDRPPTAPQDVHKPPEEALRSPRDALSGLEWASYVMYVRTYVNLIGLEMGRDRVKEGTRWAGDEKGAFCHPGGFLCMPSCLEE